MPVATRSRKPGAPSTRTGRRVAHPPARLGRHQSAFVAVGRTPRSPGAGTVLVSRFPRMLHMSRRGRHPPPSRAPWPRRRMSPYEKRRAAILFRQLGTCSFAIIRTRGIAISRSRNCGASHPTFYLLPQKCVATAPRRRVRAGVLGVQPPATLVICSLLSVIFPNLLPLISYLSAAPSDICYLLSQSVHSIAPRNGMAISRRAAFFFYRIEER